MVDTTTKQLRCGEFDTVEYERHLGKEASVLFNGKTPPHIGS